MKDTGIEIFVNEKEDDECKRVCVCGVASPTRTVRLNGKGGWERSTKAAVVDERRSIKSVLLVRVLGLGE